MIRRSGSAGSGPRPSPGGAAEHRRPGAWAGGGPGEPSKETKLTWLVSTLGTGSAPPAWTGRASRCRPHGPRRPGERRCGPAGARDVPRRCAGCRHPHGGPGSGVRRDQPAAVARDGERGHLRPVTPGTRSHASGRRRRRAPRRPARCGPPARDHRTCRRGAQEVGASSDRATCRRRPVGRPRRTRDGRRLLTPATRRSLRSTAKVRSANPACRAARRRSAGSAGVATTRPARSHAGRRAGRDPAGS